MKVKDLFEVMNESQIIVRIYKVLNSDLRNFKTEDLLENTSYENLTIETLNRINDYKVKYFSIHLNHSHLEMWICVE